MSLLSGNNSVLDRLSESSSGRHCRIPAKLLIVVLALVSSEAFLPVTLAQAPAVPPTVPVHTSALKQGVTVEQKLASDKQTYQLDLEHDQYVDLLLIKGDLKLVATVFTPQGKH